VNSPLRHDLLLSLLLNLKQSWNLIIKKLIVIIMRLEKLLTIKSPQPMPPSLFDQFEQARREFNLALYWYNSVSDTYLLEYARYQKIAAQKKYNYLLEKIRAEESLKY